MEQKFLQLDRANRVLAALPPRFTRAGLPRGFRGSHGTAAAPLTRHLLALTQEGSMSEGSLVTASLTATVAQRSLMLSRSLQSTKHFPDRNNNGIPAIFSDSQLSNSCSEATKRPREKSSS
jgi:hypothetical protein